MTTLRPTLLAALATLLGSAALSQVFADAGWLPEVVAVVLAVTAAGLLSRRLGVPALLQPAPALLAAGVVVCLVYARDTLALLVVPTTATAERLGAILGQGLLDVQEQAAPAATTPGLVLLTVLGVAAVATLVDLVAVALRRPALAGLPLLALVAVPSGMLPGGVGWWPFLLAATGWLLLLTEDAGARVARWGTTVRPGARSAWSESSLGRVGRRIGVAALGVAVVVPALLPGMQARLLDGGTGDGIGGSRSRVTYNPLIELAGQLRLPDPRTLLVYRTTDPEPDYLRLTTLDRFDGNGWSASELSGDVREDRVSGGIPVPADVRGARAREITMTLDPAALDGPWLPLAPFPTRIDIEGPWLWDDGSDTVFSTRRQLSDIAGSYQVTARRVLPDPARLRAAQVYPPAIEALAQPPEVTPYVRRTTEQVVAGARTGYDKVVALQAFFRSADNGFVYSVDGDVPSTATDDGLERFLRVRQGFCQQYASAMAAMVRLLGMPVRVAVGFLPGQQQADGSYRVTTDDAHAWPEVWFAGAGWVRFEPTPRTGRVITPGYTDPQAADVPEPVQPSAPASVQPAAPAPTTPAGPQGGGRDLEDPLAGTTPTSSGRSLSVGRVLLGLTVVAVLALPALLAALRRRARWRDPGPRTAWEQVLEDAADVGHRADPAHSPLTAAAALLTARPLPGAAAAALRRLAVAVERVRYAPPGAAGDVAAVELRRDTSAVRSGLLRTASPRTRWTARLAPPSALRWAAQRSGTAVADVLDRSDEAVAAVSARVRRRPAG